MNHEVFADKFDTTEFGRWLRQQYPRYLRAAARIIAVSHATKADVVRFYGIDESLIDIVHLATDARHFFVERDDRSFARVRDTLKGNLRYLLYVGSRNPMYKNFETLLRAIAQCARATELTLVVAGPAWKRDEESILAGRRLKLCSAREHPNIDLLRSLYNFPQPLFSLPSRGWSSLLERWRAGRRPSPQYERIPGVAGDAAVYFAPSDVADLVRAIEELSDKTIRETHVQRGFAQVAKYSWDRCAAETYAVYERVLGDSTPARRTLRGRD